MKTRGTLDFPLLPINPWKNNKLKLPRRSDSPFPSSSLPLCQNETKCEAILMKMSVFMQIKLKTRFDTEANQKSEMGY